MCCMAVMTLFAADLHNRVQAWDALVDPPSNQGNANLNSLTCAEPVDDALVGAAAIFTSICNCNSAQTARGVCPTCIRAEANGFELEFSGKIKFDGLDKTTMKMVVGYHTPSKHIVAAFCSRTEGASTNDVTPLKKLLTDPAYKSVSRPFEVCNKCFLDDRYIQSNKKLVDHDAVQVMRTLREKYPDSYFLFTGHSFGAISAIMTAISLKVRAVGQNKNLWQRVRIVTFGQPRFGNMPLAQWISTNFRSVRFVNKADPIPHLPQKPSIVGAISGSGMNPDNTFYHNVQVRGGGVLLLTGRRSIGRRSTRTSKRARR